MKKYLKYIAVCLLLPIGIVACNDYLDVMPDNRAELNTKEKVISFLASAYPANSFVLSCELASDNTDDYGSNNPYGNRFHEQLYSWVDVTETNNEAPERVWGSCYNAIAVANNALMSIEEMGDPESLRAAKGEALVARAYSHFILVNMFGQHYSPEYSETDLGITYIRKAETDLNPKYERETVAENYKSMEEDLLAGLPLIDDALYSVPKYHFNTSAAHAFAARFFLYYQKWDKAVEHANIALTDNPKTILRDNIALGAIPRDPMTKVSIEYAKSSHKCNFLIHTAYSQLGTFYGGYYTGSRYTHGGYVSSTETLQAFAPWGRYDKAKQPYIVRPFVYSGNNLDKTLLPRIPYMFEYTDPVAGIGYTRAVYVPFTAEETLLVRAEAKAMLKKYSESIADLQYWIDNNIINNHEQYVKLTEDIINNWADELNYYTPTAPTPKKVLNPDFTIEKGMQENLIHAILYIRRHETLHTGLRWFDVKRYGIEIYRREIVGGNSAIEKDKLVLRDNRRAMQLPKDVITAGLTPNPR